MDPFYLLIGILLLIASASIFLLLYGQKKNKELKAQLLESLAPLKDRIDWSIISSKIDKIPYPKAKIYADETIEKYNLIDSLETTKDSFANYSEFVKELEQLDLGLVKTNIEKAFRLHEKIQFLSKKYGDDIANKLINYDYFLGMTEEQLVDCKGKPTKIETEVMKTKTKVIYIYGNKSSGDVFNFVNGELERFHDR